MTSGLLENCYGVRIEIRPKATSTTLFLATLIALQLIYQTRSTVASRFAPFRLLPIPPPLRFRLWRLVQNTKPASTLQGVFSGTCRQGGSRAARAPSSRSRIVRGVPRLQPGRVRANGQTRFATMAGNYLSSNDKRLHFGPGSARSASGEMAWPQAETEFHEALKQRIGYVATG